jgi:flagellar hook assembly protein FlgD
LSKPADISISIYSLSGELQKSYVFVAGETGAIPGYNRVEWDGKNQFNETVANGVYIAYVVAKSEGKTKKGKIKLWVKK